MSDTWYYADANGPVGPLTLQELKSTLRGAPNWKETLVWRDGFSDWQRAGAVPEFLRAPPPLPQPTTAKTVGPTAIGSAKSAPKINVLNFLFSFRGRHNRAKYWLICLLSILWLGGFAFLAYAAPIQNEHAAVYISLACIVVAIWVGLANCVKRLHDINASGWWTIFIIGIGPVINMVATVVAPGGQRALAGIGLLIGISTTVILGGVEGTVGNNRFGPDPVRRDPETV